MDAGKPPESHEEVKIQPSNNTTQYMALKHISIWNRVIYTHLVVQNFGITSLAFRHISCSFQNKLSKPNQLQRRCCHVELQNLIHEAHSFCQFKLFVTSQSMCELDYLRRLVLELKMTNSLSSIFISWPVMHFQLISKSFCTNGVYLLTKSV